MGRRIWLWLHVVRPWATKSQAVTQILEPIRAGKALAGKERERVTPRGQEEEGEGTRGREGGGGSRRWEEQGEWKGRGFRRETVRGDGGETAGARNVWERGNHACSTRRWLEGKGSGRAGEGDDEAEKGWACREDCRQWDGREDGDDDKRAVPDREGQGAEVPKSAGGVGKGAPAGRGKGREQGEDHRSSLARVEGGSACGILRFDTFLAHALTSE
ncbi:hypothetical protein EDB89DRAFT_1912865 [Lactarius sanguifluus]|nr:hypothetical protein EDB89DRAFT_1912865 [Lactarius sanguifluus]